MEQLSVNDILRISFGLTLIILNMLSIIVLCRAKKLPAQISRMSMNLAITDMSFGMISFLKGLHVHLVSVYSCRVIFHSHIALTLVTCSIITTMAFDRFMAIRFPISYQHKVKSVLIRIGLVFPWIFGFGISAFTLIRMDNFHYMKCDYIDEMYGIFGFRLYAAVWISVIMMNLVFYFGVFLKLRRREKFIQTCTIRSAASTNTLRIPQASLERKILIRLLAVTGIFVITYVPNLTLATVIAFDHQNRSSYKMAFFYTVLIKMFNSFCNPFVYFLRYEECRRLIRRVFRTRCQQCREDHGLQARHTGSYSVYSVQSRCTIDTSIADVSFEMY
ncbi:hypothetical protein FSP39_005036 [Pinctada imbricata]|uniref:G-protein coupled receptors family 1 profile domain-containing protein n=1 Tax=Pinctada imbricata TaxID=66713 RepID=A0AA88XVI6_PINIB|nr:hypothetical protein FSP39_005036 [Pinctada imbricata]